VCELDTLHTTVLSGGTNDGSICTRKHRYIGHRGASTISARVYMLKMTNHVHLELYNSLFSYI
jgi:hypothetical protein